MNNLWNIIINLISNFNANKHSNTNSNSRFKSSFAQINDFQGLNNCRKSIKDFHNCGVFQYYYCQSPSGNDDKTNQNCDKNITFHYDVFFRDLKNIKSNKNKNCVEKNKYSEIFIKEINGINASSGLLPWKGNNLNFFFILTNKCLQLILNRLLINTFNIIHKDHNYNNNTSEIKTFYREAF